MKFDATKSKLFSDIMAAAVTFFNLGEDATETEIHDKLTSQAPLDEQLQAARSAAETQNSTDIVELRKQMEDLKKAQETYKSEMEAKDARIAELQVEISNANTATEQLKTSVEAMKVQHKKEVETLAGQVAQYRAGKTTQHEVAGDEHAAAKKTNQSNATVVSITSDELGSLLKKRNPNGLN